MRGTLFQVAYWVLSIFYVLVSLPFLAWPGHSPVRAIIRSYTRAMNLALRHIAGIRKEVRGRERLPQGAFVIGAKHQSWGDGFLIYPEVKDLAFVTGDHLERFPLVGGILKKLGAIVIDTCGGGEKKASSLADGMNKAKADGRRVLIYPEGHLAPVGYHFRYKAGLWHMAEAMGVPVVPVATNIGVFWQQQEAPRRPGTAVIEFLDPIPPGLPKAEFLARLTEAVERRTAELVAEATGQPFTPTTLIPDPPNGFEASPTASDLAAYKKA
ncbi:acyltransferase family protein [Hyphomonas neptunium ATCC 15444]|uniref:Acyltransferase family protein n=2 Tax=Hyphomonas TaxID=85 RepID=Q0BYZ6_HYPNA|nr:MULTISPECIES: 1-acyl-sn-glycerol-3-phosphate acyltransferase [Hyphomonas]ABI75714.1 acyltransferase family protein [Hyphomonas neptunium ATCC 15444]KCZ87292.1 acyltransferase family protein [Hyphomonas hirschiana VP5]